MSVSPSDPPGSMSRSSITRGNTQLTADQMLQIATISSSAMATSTLLGSPPSLEQHEPKASSTSSSSHATHPTSSRTRERLRLTEEERDSLREAVLMERANPSEMRHLADKQRLVAKQLKFEGNTATASLSITNEKLRMLELERDARAVRAEKRTPTQGLFKEACSTDLLFLIDTTASMTEYISAAKQQVIDIVDDIKDAFLNEADIRIAVVSYKDHRDHNPHNFLDFTTSPDAVRSFISRLTASGGGDTPEDVLGGVQRALNSSWRQRTRCIIHIADAPAHGRDLNNCEDDKFPTPGSEPHGLTYEPLLKQMTLLKINYAFLRITELTDIMTYSFLKQYAAAGADGSLHGSNRFYDAASRNLSAGSRFSGSTATSGLLFAEKELGTTYSELRQLVVSTVTSSASRTAVRLSFGRSSSTRSTKGCGTKTLQKKSGLSVLSEEEPTADVALDRSPPLWDVPGWLDEQLVVEGFSPNAVLHNAFTLDSMMAADENISMSVSELTISKRPRPFAQGAMRVAYYAQTAASSDRYVVKSFKRGGKRLAHLVEDMRCQALCKIFALEFNALAEGKQATDFITTTCFKGSSKRGRDSAVDCLSLEPFIQGIYHKYNNNCGWVNAAISHDRFNQAAQAFSHFTFERSQGRFLVCDLQGVGCVFTDPAIHTRDPERFKLIDSNLGEDGFKFFFSTHVCNDICAKLELNSNAAMLKNGGRLMFRTKWPLMDRTTCCSNKLCGKIINTSSAVRSEEYRGYHWCTTCWPQLSVFMKRWICIAGESDHEFDVSTFFYQSQGRRAPRKCSEHREGSGSVTHRGNVYQIDRATSGWHSSATPLNAPLLSLSLAAHPSSPAADASSTCAAIPAYVTLPPGTLPPSDIGAVATLRNSNSLWGRLKSATKIKKSPSRNILANP